MVLIAGKPKLAVKGLFWKNVDKYFDIQISFQWDNVTLVYCNVTGLGII